jgi:hypothetical protein
VTEELESVHVALAKAKAEVEAVGKNRRNQQQNFNFRGVDDVVNAAAGPLNRHGIITVPELLSADYGVEEVGQKRTPMAHVRIQVAYHFYGPKGDHIRAVVPAEAMDSGDKAVPKAMSVAYRIALIQVLNLPTDDRDPDDDTYQRSEPGSEESQAAPQRQARGRQPGPAPVPDAVAQDIADKVIAVEDVKGLRALHTEASTAGKLSEPVKRGDKYGTLGQLINVRKGELERATADA